MTYIKEKLQFNTLHVYCTILYEKKCVFDGKEI